MMWHTPPAEESRKYDIHACEAGMNIIFPFFSCGQQNIHQRQVILYYEKKRAIGALFFVSLCRERAPQMPCGAKF
jgi:hypothetical protein